MEGISGLSTMGTISSGSLPAWGISNGTSIPSLGGSNLPAFGVVDGVYVPTLISIPGLLDFNNVILPDGLSPSNLPTNSPLDTNGDSNQIFGLNTPSSSSTIMTGDSSNEIIMSSTTATTEGSLSNTISTVSVSDPSNYPTLGATSGITNNDQSSSTATSSGILIGDQSSSTATSSGILIGDQSTASSVPGISGEGQSTVSSDSVIADMNLSTVSSGPGIAGTSQLTTQSVSGINSNDQSTTTTISGISTSSQFTVTSETGIVGSTQGTGDQSTLDMSVSEFTTLAIISGTSASLSTLTSVGSDNMSIMSTTGIITGMEIVTPPPGMMISNGNITGILTGTVSGFDPSQQPGTVNVVGSFVGTITSIVSNADGSTSLISRPVTGSFSGIFTATDAVTLPSSGTVTGIISGTVSGPTSCFPACAGTIITGSIIGTVVPPGSSSSSIMPSPLPADNGLSWVLETPSSMSETSLGTDNPGISVGQPDSTAASLIPLPGTWPGLQSGGGLSSVASVTPISSNPTSSGSSSNSDTFINIGYPATEATSTDGSFIQTIDIGLQVNTTVQSLPISATTGLVATQDLFIPLGAIVEADAAAVAVAGAAVSAVAGSSSTSSSTSSSSVTSLFTSSLISIFTTTNDYPSWLGYRPCLTVQLPALRLDFLRSVSFTKVPLTVCLKLPPLF
jgi:hypothetical protein